MVGTLSLVLVAGMTSPAFAETEVVFFEDFDDTLTGWNQILCIASAPDGQICQIGQATELVNDPPNEPPNSLSFWGFVEVADSIVSTPVGPVETRYAKSFSIIEEDDYELEAVLGIKDCRGTGICHIETNLALPMRSR